MIIKQKPLSELEKLLKTTNGFNDLTKYCDSVFQILDKYIFRMKSRKITEPENVDSALDKVTGYRGYINPLLEVLEAHKKNKEAEAYINFKEEVEKKGDKFVSAIAERKASKSISQIRTLRNKVKGYIDQCNIMIGVLQSKLNYYRDRKGWDK